MARLRPVGSCRLIDRDQEGTEPRADWRSTALKTPRRADSKERPHPQSKIERAGMHEQALQHIVVSANVRASKAAGLVEMRTRSLQQFTALEEEPLPSGTADAPPIRIHGVPFVFLVSRRLRSTIGFADVGADPQSFQIVQGGAAVVALIRDNLCYDDDRVIRDGRCGFELFGSFRQRSLNRRSIALVSILQGNANDRARRQVNRVLRLVRQMRSGRLSSW